jgi:hypothetical protein
VRSPLRSRHTPWCPNARWCRRMFRTSFARAE